MKSSVKRDRAAPIVEVDDFEDEAQRDAESYITRRKNEAAAKAWKEENKRRKQLGLSPARKPRPEAGRAAGRATGRRGPSSPRRILFGREAKTDDTVSGSDRDEDGDGVSVGGKRKRVSDKDAGDEGQVILGFNPLERIAGLESSPRGRVREPKVVASVERIKREAGQTPSRHDRDEKPSLIHDVKPDIKPEIITRSDTVSHDMQQSRRHSVVKVKLDPDDATNVEAGIGDDNNDAEEEEEGDYDATDDFIILPDGPLPGRALGEATLEDDDYYSDDQLFAQDKSASSETPSTESSLQDDDVPPVRPDFLDDDKMPVGEALLLGGNIAVPAPLNRYLKSYQREGVKFFYDKYAAGKGFVLGDEMGLGKTIQVIAFLSAIMRKTGTSQDHKRRKKLVRRTSRGINAQHWPTALIVCPKFLIRNREFATWGYFEVGVWQTDSVRTVKQDLERGYLDVVLASYETTRNTIDLLKDMPFSVVIVDEAHRLKEPKARLTLALKKFIKPTCFALTGTLIQNRARPAVHVRAHANSQMEEIWSLLDFVDRGWAGTRNQWKDFVVDPLRKGFRFDTVIADFVEACTRLGIMHDRVMPYFYLRRDKRLIADELPEKQDRVVFCPLAERQIRAYRSYIASPDVQFILHRKDPCDCGSDKEFVLGHHAEMRADDRRGKCCYKLTAEGETLRQVLLKSINAMTKIANHLGLLYHMDADSETTQDANRRIFQACMGEEYDPRIHRIRDATLDAANCGKWTLLRHMLTEWRNDRGAKNKVLIFSNSVRLLKMVEHFITMTMDGFNYSMITGEVDIDARMDMVDRFQDPSQDEYILLISTLAGGVGLNLTAANKVVIFDPAWNPASDLQAMDRAFRIGQKRTVEVYRLIGQGTLEELMYERQIQKQQRARQLNEGTFENRLHQGMEKGRTKEEQGELFGVQNIFKFDPNGFVPGRIERVQQAQDKFVADLIEAEYEEDEEVVEEDEEAEAARVKTLQGRKQRDLERAKTIRARRDHEVVESVLGEAEVAETREESLFRSLNITTQAHDSVFKDSPEERAIFEIGLKILKSNPEVAKHMRANDVGRYRGPKAKDGRDKDKASPAKKVRQAGDPENEPWKHRRKPNGKSVLAELSD